MTRAQDAPAARNETGSSRACWRRIWRQLGLHSGGDAVHRQLASLYGAPGRRYHTVRHIEECLREFDRVRALAAQPVEVEMALWFHDAVYDPRAQDNEERSAGLMRESLLARGAAAGIVNSIQRLILATTRHVPSAGDSDEALVIDIDLAVLGQPEARFDEYERQIRAEYARVPVAEFHVRRAEILRRFLDRPHIFATPSFRVRYEESARRNLRRSLRALTAPARTE